MKELPISIQNFRKLIMSGCLYVDKTEQIYHLIKRSEAYFLSRPRRFGKSLLLSTMQEIFLGNRELFKGLWIDSSDYDWQKYPVLYLDFSALNNRSVAEFEVSLGLHLQQFANKYSIDLTSIVCVTDKIYLLLCKIYQKTQQQVVILIDEYDYPILSHLHDIEKATALQKASKDFFTMIKTLDQYVRFTFLTGVSKIANTSVFSGLNSLNDLSQDVSTATILGYTQAELETNFYSYLLSLTNNDPQQVPELLIKMKYWYNGYRFSSSENKVYNPYSVLLCLRKKEFKNYWFKSGTPTFLINVLKMKGYDFDHIENQEIQSEQLDAFEFDKIPLHALLYQTGYLTISDYNAEQDSFILNYPNYEVQHSLLQSLMQACMKIEPNETNRFMSLLKDSLKKGNTEIFLQTLKIVYANLPYTIYLKYEKFYQSMFYLTMSLLGAKVYVEMATNQGRIDAIIETADAVYLFEFKVDVPGSTALQQIKEKEYAQPFLLSSKKKVLIGLSFDTTMHNLRDDWAVEVIT